MTERRRHTRQKSLLRGCVYFNNRRSAVDCLIRDVSASSARLIFSGPVNLPSSVDLYIPQKEQMLRAHVQWRRGDEMGVTFSDELRASGAPREQDLGRRVEKLETQIVSLRRMLRQLKTDFTTRTEGAA